MACGMEVLRCATHYPRHVVVNVLSIKLWSQIQALSIPDHHITFNPITSTLHHGAIAINHHLSSTIIVCCGYPLSHFMNSIICIIICLYKFKINIVFVFELCLASNKIIYTNLQSIILHHKKKYYFKLILFKFKKINYNMLCILNNSYNKILIT